MRYTGMCCRLAANCVISATHFWRGTPCWDWKRKTTKDRSKALVYGTLNVRVRGEHKTMRAHRVSMKCFLGTKFRKGHESNHLCGRTICINPLHLERVTRTRNEHYKRFFERASEAPPDTTFDLGRLVYTEPGEIPF